MHKIFRYSFTTGSIIGVLADIVGILIVAGTLYEDGLNNIQENTSKDISLLGGIVSGLVVSVVITITVSLNTHMIKSKDDADYQWKRTLAIDNPLNPWRLNYKQELLNVPLGTPITSEHIGRVFKRAKAIALFGG